MSKKKEDETPANARKRLIIEAAVECFIEKGYHQTGVRDLAGKAGISLGNLYNHFAGKDAVLTEIAALEADELEVYKKVLADHAKPTEALMRFAGSYLDYAARTENALLGLEIVSEAVRNPQIARAFSENRENLINALSGLLEAGTNAGKFRPSGNIAEMAKLILDLIEGKALRSVLADTPSDTTADEEFFKMISLATGA